MGKLPVCSGWSVVRAFERAGWRQVRQKGSHVTLTMSASTAILTVPLHSELDRGTLRALVRRAGLTTEEFIRYSGRL